ncbi:hypothetical protein QTG56_01730 [Rossellomorea sp. AcN35-11]|nr:hypothetical protein QTG56_01730 [Rossellomorea sp. AcN35-11]
MSEMKVRSIMKQFHHSDPGKRFEAVGSLYELKENDHLQIRIEVLKDMVKAARLLLFLSVWTVGTTLLLL